HDPRPSAPMVSSHPRLYLIFWYHTITFSLLAREKTEKSASGSPVSLSKGTKNPGSSGHPTVSVV
ncbi:MAG: hypothetical protein Q3Y02_02905, partial [Dysosmobacter sp.]|nr:hypothetical protein [Dysosmobacter sp.]